ncbi:hypothetical protein HQ533_03875 [Candidatus Woesearchaeota archaeon]|nr:hypothetical protein [Candidatus Woesearchaeota archaeon]
MQNFDLMLDGRLEEVTLTMPDSSGTIPLFGDKTEEVAKLLFESIQIYNPGLKSQKFERRKDEVYWLIEHYAKIGAYAASIANDESRVYEIGCGIALPSIAFNLLTNRPVSAIDTDRKQIMKGLMLAGLLHAKVDFLPGFADILLSKYDLREKDIVLYCGQANDLTIFQKELTKLSGCTSVFSYLCKAGDNVRDYTTVVANDFLNGVSLDVGLIEREPDRAVFIARG